MGNGSSIKEVARHIVNSRYDKSKRRTSNSPPPQWDQGSNPTSFLDSFLQALEETDVGKIVAAASIEQLDELNRVLCRPVATELERKLSKAAKEAEPTIKILVTASNDGSFEDGEEHNDGGLYDGGIISELLGPEGHRNVVHKAVNWAITAASFAPTSPPDGCGAEVVESLRRFLCSSGFIHGLGIDEVVPSKKRQSAASRDMLEDSDGSLVPDTTSAGSSGNLRNKFEEAGASGTQSTQHGNRALRSLRTGCMSRLWKLGTLLFCFVECIVIPAVMCAPLIQFPWCWSLPC